MVPAIDHDRSHIDDITALWQRELGAGDLSKLLLAIYLQRLGRVIEQDFERFCQTRYKMRSSDMRILLALRRSGAPYAMRPTDLFRALLVTSGAVTKQVDRLEQRKMVERLPDPAYGRGFRVQLTRRGREIVDEVLAALREGAVIPQAMSELSAQEREAATRLCYRIISLVENPGEEAEPAKKRARRA